jgi:hypothetical protein
MDTQFKDPTYIFIQPSDIRRFQEELRDKHLLGTFDVDRIKSHRSSNYGEAGNQDIKLWRSKDMDQIHTISFYANHIKEHLEFPLHWFSPDISAKASKTTVQLTFAKRSEQFSESLSRAESIGSRLSLGISNTSK